MNHKILYVTIIFILLDIVITLSFWHYEANPIVLQIGPLFFTAIKLSLIPIIIVVYNSLFNYKPSIAKLSLIPLLSLYSVVVLLNVIVIL